MPLLTIEPRRLYRRIAGRISVPISDGEYTPGALKEGKPIAIRSARAGCST